MVQENATTPPLHKCAAPYDRSDEQQQVPAPFLHFHDKDSSVFRLTGSEPPDGQLGQQNGKKHQRTADSLPQGGNRSRQHHRRQERKHRLRAHDKRGGGGRCELLSDDLQSKADAVGQHAGKHDRKPHFPHGGKRGCAEKRHQKGIHDAHRQRLDKAELHPVGARRKMIDAKNMYRIQQRGRQNDEIPRRHGEPILHRHEIQGDQRDTDAAPHPARHTPAEEQTQKRHEQNIHRGDKADAAGACHGNAEILHAGGSRQRQTAAHPADPQGAAFLCRRLHIVGTALFPPKSAQHHRRQRQRTEKAAQHLKGKHIHRAARHPLDGDGAAQKAGDKQQNETSAHAFHASTSSPSS